MDFFTIKHKPTKNGFDIYPSFRTGGVKDIMVRGKTFYAIWDEENKIWSTEERDVVRLVDNELKKAYLEEREKNPDKIVGVKYMDDYSSGSYKEFKKFLKDIYDDYKPLDNKLTFASDEIKRSDYSSKRLPYDLSDESCEAWDELVETLYSPVEREKFEWAIGSIIAGDSVNIQKFFVFYGDPGSGKSTILGIIEKLFDGYTATFEAKELVGRNNSFSLEQFNKNPLVAIQHDGDLSKIDDNSKLNSLISHEIMNVNEKYKSQYSMKFRSILFMATNKPVKVTDAKAGILRRLVDIHPTGNTIPIKRYEVLKSKINFELGSIAKHCLDLYKKLGKNYYNNYKPFEMIQKTDVFYNFVEDCFDTFFDQDSTTLKAAYALYKIYYEESGLEYKMPMYKFREELKDYFKEYYDVTRVDGKQVRSYYKGFLSEKFIKVNDLVADPEKPYSLILENIPSLLDEELKDCPAQYANEKETPSKKWNDVRTHLSDIDTSRIHYVMCPENYICIDFDLKDDDGNKSFERNLEAASKWPATYAEVSKGGNGIHLHYIYDGDASKLARLYSEGIEIKVFNGNSSLRRKLTACNNIPIAHISSGLPLKEEKMVNFDAIKSEKGLRTLIERNLRKEIHIGTKPSIDFIYKILEDAYSSGMKFDMTDLRPKVMAFANNSSHQAEYCIKMVNKMKFKSDENSEGEERYLSDDLIFYDVEVFPNLFVVVWKKRGSKKCVKMINPTPEQIEDLLRHKLIGFNCRRYDNHIMYARMMGYTNEQLYQLSQRIINKSKNCFFGAAYNLSYTDIYDFMSAMNKMGLKKWEIKLDIHHQECPLPWDEPVPEGKWDMVADYCENDVISTEKTFEAVQGDWVARQILAEISGLTVNDTTNNHSTRIIFGFDQHPQDQFVYTDLSKMFPGYTFDHGVSMYRGIEVGEGGFVYAEPGIYHNIALLDIASMHPTSIEQLNLFGDKYTKVFSEIKQARLCIKHKDMDGLSKVLDGKLVKYVDSKDFNLKDLSNALKTVINSVYGLTSAKFENKFRDPRNIDNIVAKRGALFMVDLLNAVQEKGYTVAHIKTDSIKIPDADDKIIKFVMDFGKKYGYEFEHEATYEKMCLVNDAVYIAKYADGEHEFEIPTTGEKIKTPWTATGAEFAVPYVFKTLFAKAKIGFRDLCVTKSVNTTLYLDMNEDLEDVSEYEKDLKKLRKEEDVSPMRIAELEGVISQGHNYIFVGKIGQFCPILPGCGGGELVSLRGETDYYAVQGTKGYRFLESEMVKNLGKEKDINESYFLELANDAINHIAEFGDYDEFVG
jgi:hypothetical protein